MSGKPTPHPRLQRVYRSEDAAPFEFYGHDPNGQIVTLNNPVRKVFVAPNAPRIAAEAAKQLFFFQSLLLKEAPSPPRSIPRLPQAVLAKYLDRVYLKFLGDRESSKTRNFPMADGEKEYEDMADVETVRPF